MKPITMLSLTLLLGWGGPASALEFGSQGSESVLPEPCPPLSQGQISSTEGRFPQREYEKYGLEQVKTFSEEGNREAIGQLLEELSLSSFVLREGQDADLRPLFVGAQQNFEKWFVQLLRNKEATSIIGIIHTPAPATPLCTKGEPSEGLVDPSLYSDPARWLTVTSRPAILRDFLAAGGTLCTVYPQKGREKRSPEQLAVLEELLHTFPNLSESELACTEMPQDLIGATYFLTLADGNEYLLSLRSYQANCPTDDKWGIWFGKSEDPAIAKRREVVFNFLKTNGFNKEI